MAKHKTSESAEKKCRSKKRKSRREVSPPSESDSDVETKTSQKDADVIDEPMKSSPPDIQSKPKSSKKDNVKKKHKSKSSTTQPDSPQSKSPPASSLGSPPPTQVPAETTSSPAPATLDEEFSAIYLRKLTAEFADDLDKVREAPDFKASSVAMLIHALKQGESLFSVEEKRRMVGGKGA